MNQKNFIFKKISFHSLVFSLPNKLVKVNHIWVFVWIKFRCLVTLNFKCLVTLNLIVFKKNKKNKNTILLY